MTSSVICKVIFVACFLAAAAFAQKPAAPVKAAFAPAKAAPPPPARNLDSVEADSDEVEEKERLRIAVEKLEDEQASNAAYSFATSLVDGIMDNSQGRSETRSGKNVTGSYSYSDGWFRHFFEYVADQYGYRIVSEKTEAVGEGPKIDLEGKADVRTMIAGQDVQYSITKADIGKLNERKEKAEPAAVAKN